MKHLQINLISALNNPQRVDMILNKPKYSRMPEYSEI